MVYYGLTTIALIVASFGTFVANAQADTLRYMGKRDSTRDYYTLHVPDKSFDAAQHVARQLEVRYEGSIGELDTWYMISSPKPVIEKRNINDAILEAFERFKTSKKRDENYIHFQKVQGIDKQVLKRRTKKRAPVFEVDILADAQKTLNINDPWFNQQWHLVKVSLIIGTIIKNN
jgi:kexin